MMTSFALAFACSVLLLWLSAGLAAQARASSPRLAHDGASIALVALAVWSPAQLIVGGAVDDPATLATPSALLLLLAVLLAGASHMAARCARRRATLPVALGSALLAWLCAGGYAVWAWPQAFGLYGVLPPLVSAPLLTLLAAALVAMQWPRADGERAWRPLRSAASILGAAVLALGAALHGGDAATFDLSFAVPTLASAGVSALLLFSAAARPRRAATEVANEAQNDASPPVTVDALTKLPNRLHFEEQLAAHVARADAHKGRLALLFIDLDGFKPVNDTFGHRSGDLVLKQVSERLKRNLRAHDVLTRIGGDEFVLLITGDPSQDVGAQLAKRLIDDISRPYLIEEREVAISCSIGIVFYPDAGAHTNLIARADAAMYAAKRNGGGTHCFYTPEMDEDARDKFDLIRDLRLALERGEMELYFQPKIDARSRQVTAAEALMRWKHPKRGLVPPSVFIPLAERNGLIVVLGNWVIEEACRQARSWREHGLRMRLAVNLSAHQLRQDDLVERIEGALDSHRIHPSLLTCEITESVAMEDTKATQDTFRRLGQAGIHLSIDDFGTGYSSLSYLRRLPAEELKIDRSFVMDLDSSSDARAVVDAVIKLAHALGLRVVAEGVETPRQQALLTEMGCDELQGYLFAKPMTARALLLWAIDDQSRALAFRNSLFGDTLAVEHVNAGH
jgi:diguanylate cyclase (GGDEF)-like protein